MANAATSSHGGRVHAKKQVLRVVWLLAMVLTLTLLGDDASAFSECSGSSFDCANGACVFVSSPESGCGSCDTIDQSGTCEFTCASGSMGFAYVINCTDYPTHGASGDYHLMCACS